MTQKTITINGKEYEMPKINYRSMLELEELGFNMQHPAEKMLTSYAALVALTVGVDQEQAADLIDEHCENGGSLGDFAPLMYHIADSGFFTKMSGQNPQKNQ